MHLQGHAHLHWMKENYFSKFNKKNPKKAVQALDLLVEDLHTSKENSINAIISNPNLDDIISGLCQLLLSSSSRVCGNSAYALGTLAENEVGAIRVIRLITRCTQFNVVETLLKLLYASDQEAVMNAAGTLGALAEFQDGRNWILDQNFFVNLIERITDLLRSNDLWTAGNAALVIARISMSDEGLQALCSLKVMDTLTANVISCLGVDEAGRGMNAAFALGRFSDYPIGMEVISKSSARKQLTVSLNDMLRGSDPGCAKNACFCLSSLASSKLGHSLVISCQLIDDILRYLCKLLMSEDPETAWFAGMTFRTLACQPKGCLKLRSISEVIPSLQECVQNPKSADDLKEEALETLAILQTIEKPSIPKATVLGANEVQIEMDAYTAKNKFGMKYQVIRDGSTVVYEGTNNSVVIKSLQPYTQYSFSYCMLNDVDTSPPSESVTVKTEECVPSAPTNLRTLVVTHTQAKIVWEPPLNANGILKNYTVFLDNKVVCTYLEAELLSYQHSKGKRCYDCTQELSTIVSGLTPNTNHTISVCASTIKGQGEKASLNIRTLDLGPHLPSKPVATARGRSEIILTWEPPENPLGRLTRYQVIMNNNKVVYSGLDTSCSIKGLAEETDYKFFIRAITNEGRFDSKSVKKKTGKDEYGDAQRLPLYTSANRRESLPSEVITGGNSNNSSSKKIKLPPPRPKLSFSSKEDGEETNTRPLDLMRKEKINELEPLTSQTRKSAKLSANKDVDLMQLPMKTFEMINIPPRSPKKSAKSVDNCQRHSLTSSRLTLESGAMVDFVSGESMHEGLEQTVILDKSCYAVSPACSPTLIVANKEPLGNQELENEEVEESQPSCKYGDDNLLTSSQSLPAETHNTINTNRSDSKLSTLSSRELKEMSGKEESSVSTLTLEDVTQASLGNSSSFFSGTANYRTSELSNKFTAEEILKSSKISLDTLDKGDSLDSDRSISKIEAQSLSLLNMEKLSLHWHRRSSELHSSNKAIRHPPATPRSKLRNSDGSVSPVSQTTLSHSICISKNWAETSSSSRTPDLIVRGRKLSTQPDHSEGSPILVHAATSPIAEMNPLLNSPNPSIYWTTCQRSPISQSCMQKISSMISMGRPLIADHSHNTKQAVDV